MRRWCHQFWHFRKCVSFSAWKHWILCLNTSEIIITFCSMYNRDNIGGSLNCFYSPDVCDMSVTGSLFGSYENGWFEDAKLLDVSRGKFNLQFSRKMVFFSNQRLFVVNCAYITRIDTHEINIVMHGDKRALYEIRKNPKRIPPSAPWPRCRNNCV